MVTTQSIHTLADLVELPDDSPIYDILGGEFVVRNIPDVNHAIARIELTGFLYAAYEAGYGYLFSDTTAVALDYPARGEEAEHVSHPDLFFVRQEREHAISNRVIEGVPDLIVEILSSSTREEHERGGKRWHSYELHGVPQYWIVDNGLRTLTQYALVGEPYRAGRYGAATVLRPGDTLTCSLFPTLSLPVAKLFRNVRDRPPGRKASAGRSADQEYRGASPPISSLGGGARNSAGIQEVGVAAQRAYPCLISGAAWRAASLSACWGDFLSVAAASRAADRKGMICCQPINFGVGRP